MHRKLLLIVLMLSLLFSAGTVNGQGTPTEGIVIASPRQDEHWQVSTRHEILWKAGSLFDLFRPSRVNIALLDERQQRIVMMIANNVPNRGKYLWSIPLTVSAAKYRIGVIRTPDSKYGISKSFYITDLPPTQPPTCTPGANSDDICRTCENTATCEGCGTDYVFSNGQCVKCSGERVKVVNNFPENVAGSQRACVDIMWSESQPSGGSGGPASCFAGPPWYWPAGWVTAHNATEAMGYSTDGSAEGFNQITARALEVYEWSGSDWVASCTCRKKHVYTGGSKSLEKRDCGYPQNSWSCTPISQSCDWQN